MVERLKPEEWRPSLCVQLSYIAVMSTDFWPRTVSILHCCLHVKLFGTASCELCFVNQSILPSDSSDNPPGLALRDLSVCLVDCMKTPGLNGQILHVAAERSHAGIAVELKEEDEQSEDFENPPQRDLKLDQQPDWCDVGAEIDLYKEEGVSECDDKDPNWEDAKTEVTAELQPSHVGAGACGSDGVTWLIQDYRLSESLKTATLSNSEERQEEADGTDAKSQRNNNVTTREQHEAEDASEPGGKCFYKIENVV